VSTEVDGCIGPTSRALGALGRAAQRLPAAAGKRRGGGRGRPRASAVVRVMPSTPVVGGATGRSPGVAPVRRRATSDAARRQRSAGLT
jgi:hypothetical protein